MTPPHPGRSLRCALAAAALWACGGGSQQGEAAPQRVKVARVEARDVALREEFVARTEAAHSVEIRAQVGGLLQRIAFEEGAWVEAGQLLFAIDPERYEAAAVAARAALAEVRAASRKSAADVERYRPLVEARAIPREQLDTALASAEQGRASVNAARARLEQAQLELGYTRLFAPVRGRIGPSLVKTGALIEPGSTLLDTLYGVDPIDVDFNVGERYYLEVRAQLTAGGDPPPRPVRLLLSDGSVYAHEGHLEMIAPDVELGTGTLLVRASFPNPEGLLRPGMFGRAQLVLRELAGARVIPARALQELQGRESVWVVDASGTAQSRQVELGPRLGDAEVVIASGLEPGERVIVEGAQQLRPGARVEAIEEAEAAAFSAVARAPVLSVALPRRRGGARD